MEFQIDLAQFKTLLTEIENTDVLIRMRLAGERWMEYSKVILVSENACILQEGVKPRRAVLNLRAVVEFAIDRPHFDYIVNIPYRIDHP